MTVCLAALFDNGKGAVLVSDHMITANIPIGYEFENEETSKIHGLTDNTYALSAGNVLIGDEIIQLSRATVAVQGQEHARDIADIVKSKYQEFRLSYVEENYLTPRGLTLESYYGRHTSLNPGMVQLIDETMEKIDIGVEFIVVGPTGTGYGIYVITNPGVSTCVDAIGFVSIGSGAPHVIYSLLGATYKKSLGKEEVKKLVTKAKEISEVAPGVGKETSIHILSEEEK